jgi:hypothetical protein
VKPASERRTKRWLPALAIRGHRGADLIAATVEENPCELGVTDATIS